MGSGNRGGEAVSKEEAARIILAPSGVVLLRGGSGFVSPFVYCKSESEISQCDTKIALTTGE
jgi:hypothetical protein